MVVRAMTRDQQVRKALELLAPPPRHRAECQRDIEMALNWVERHVAAVLSFRVAGSKKGKAGLRRYRDALRRLNIAYRTLDPAISPWFSLAETAYVPGQTVIDREIAKAEAFLGRASLPPHRDASRNKAAVLIATYLLDRWGHKAAVTRSGKWARLAKILAGDPRVDLFDHLREFKRRPTRTSRKCGVHTRSPIARGDGNRVSNRYHHPS